jgi:HSP20 family molecular chaperone IbpA
MKTFARLSCPWLQTQSPDRFYIPLLGLLLWPGIDLALIANIMNKTAQDIATPFASPVVRAPLQRETALASWPLVWQPEVAPLEVRESQAAYYIVAPLSGMDARNFYVIATPRSIQIEIRLNRVRHHKTTETSILERIEQRIERELALPTEIEKSKTTVRITPESLFITAPKAMQSQGETWSQLVLF